MTTDGHEAAWCPLTFSSMELASMPTRGAIRRMTLAERDISVSRAFGRMDEQELTTLVEMASASGASRRRISVDRAVHGRRPGPQRDHAGEAAVHRNDGDRAGQRRGTRVLTGTGRNPARGIRSARGKLHGHRELAPAISSTISSHGPQTSSHLQLLGGAIRARGTLQMRVITSPGRGCRPTVRGVAPFLPS